MVRPAARKEMVGHLQDSYGISQRHACRVIPISRKAVGYESTRQTLDKPLLARLRALAEQYPRYGYLMLHSMLKGEGLVVNKKRTYRLYTALQLQVRTKKRKKLTRPRVPMAIPSRPMSAGHWILSLINWAMAGGSEC